MTPAGIFVRTQAKLNKPGVSIDLVLMALQRGASPLALIDGSGELLWCSDSFSALFAPAARPGQSLRTLLGETVFERLVVADIEVRSAAVAGEVWSLSAASAEGLGRLVRAEPLAQLHAAQASVRRLEERLELVQELSKTGIFERDVVTFEGSWDGQMYRIYGLPDPGPGQPAPSYEEVSAMMRHEDLLPGAFAATLGKPGTHSRSMRMKRPDGLERRLNTHWRVYHDAAGTPQRVLGVNTDVTEVFELARGALESARRLEAAAEAARIGLWSYRLDTPLPSWNGLMFTHFGLDPKDGVLPLGDLVRRSIHPEDQARLFEKVATWWRHGEGELLIEFRVVRPKDGELRWLLARGSIHVGDASSLRYAEGVIIDITDQQRTLRQLSYTVERMKLTTRALGLGTWTANLDHSEVIWDEQMFGLRGVVSRNRRVEQQEMASYLHPDDRHLIMADQIERIGDGQPWKRTFRVVWPDGQVRWINSQSVRLVDELGRPDGRIGVNWDATDAQLTATAQRERELAVAESQAKSQAMSRISHELRTPLHAILGFTQLMRGAQTDLEKRVRWLAHIEHAGRHLLAMIDDVLELSRAEVGELKLASEVVSCSKVVEAAIPLVGGIAFDRGVKICCAQIEGLVMADPVRLSQVLLNLLTNAIKYNRPGGEARLWSSDDGEFIGLHVADTGVGIAPEHLVHVFEPFNRIGAESSEVEGSGIGLAIVKVLVESMGGQVQVRSRMGEGSEFVILLPKAVPEALAALDAPGDTLALIAEGSRQPGRARVLCLEDDKVSAQLLRSIFEQRPAFSLTIAENGHSGLQLALKNPPDLILLDMKLPDIDGFTVLRAIRADPRTAAIRCVALSANPTPDDLEAARAAGFIDYWTKPIDVVQFFERVDKLMEVKT